MDLIIFIAGLSLLIGGAEALVRGASRLARAAGVSTLVIGLTVVSFGTSAPELAISVRSAISGGPGADIAIGNVVGSNIANILLIIGLSAVAVPMVVSMRLIQLDVPIMIAASLLMLLLGADGRIGIVDGLVLLSGIAGYLSFLYLQSRKGATDESASTPGRGRRSRIWVDIGLVLTGLAMLVAGANWLVEAALSLARSMGVSELIISLSLVAVGTSLPEIATSLMAALRGERDIAVGNALGSNIFNILLVLGAAAVAAPEGVRVPATTIYFDIPVMIAVAVACLPFFFTDHLISRFEGVLFLAYYGAYLAYLYLNAGDHGALPLYNYVMIVFVAPLTVLTLGIGVWRQVKRRRLEQRPK